MLLNTLTNQPGLQWCTATSPGLSFRKLQRQRIGVPGIVSLKTVKITLLSPCRHWTSNLEQMLQPWNRSLTRLPATFRGAIPAVMHSYHDLVTGICQVTLFRKVPRDET